MNKTSVTISARGAPASGKSTLLKVINELLHTHVHTVESVYRPDEHSMRFLLPQNFAKQAQTSSDAVTAGIAMNEHQRKIIEKWSEIDKDNTATIETLNLQVKDAEDRCDTLVRERDEAFDGKRAAEAERNQAFKEMTTLKERLFTAETLVARMQGYVDRVQEMDEAARPLVPTTRESNHRASPLLRRGAGGPHEPWSDPGNADAVNYGLSPLEREMAKQRRHWTSYGQ